MNREQRRVLLRSDRMVKLESITYGKKYRIHHLSPPDTDDVDNETVIVQLESSEGDYLYSSWPTFPFETDDVSLSITGYCAAK